MFYSDGDEILEQIAQRDNRYLNTRNIQDWVGHDSEKPDLVEDVPANCRDVGLDDLKISLPTQAIL